jgi:hypothetical protein
MGGLVGASGAISGIMGAFVALYPHDEIYMPLGFFFTKAPVIIGVMFFFIMETVLTFFAPPDTIAHTAHIGGLVGGLILAVIVMKVFPSKVVSRAPVPGSVPNASAVTPPLVRIGKKLHQKPIRYESLIELATTPELEDLLDKIRREDMPEVQYAWVEHLVQKSSCPKCQKSLSLNRAKIFCKSCGFSKNISSS